VFVRKGTPAWEAWAKVKGKDPKAMLSTFSAAHRVDGWYFDTLFPLRNDQSNQGDAA
jgi:hypothetical protein